MYADLFLRPTVVKSCAADDDFFSGERNGDCHRHIVVRVQSFFSSYKTIGWVNSGLHKLNRQPAPEYKKAYEVHNTYSQHNGAIVLKGTFYIHAGPEDLTHIGWGAAGCVEIIGSFSEFKDQVKELSGSTQVDADSAISELVFYKKLYIEIEYATPPNIKANFYKEVSIKRR